VRSNYRTETGCPTSRWGVCPQTNVLHSPVTLPELCNYNWELMSRFATGNSVHLLTPLPPSAPTIFLRFLHCHVVCVFLHFTLVMLSLPSLLFRSLLLFTSFFPSFLPSLPPCLHGFFFPLTLQPQFWPCPTSMKLSVSLQSTRSYTVGRTPWTGDQHVARPMPVHKHKNAHTYTNTKHSCPEWDPSEQRHFVP
jgi:hypothetical protein